MEYSHLSVQKEPASIEEATTCSESSKWTQVMQTEMKSLKDNDVWELVELPANKKAVGSKWVYKIKTGPDGTPERYKARLVAQGFTQKFGSDYWAGDVNDRKSTSGYVFQICGAPVTWRSKNKRV